MRASRSAASASATSSSSAASPRRPAATAASTACGATTDGDTCAKPRNARRAQRPVFIDAWRTSHATRRRSGGSDEMHAALLIVSPVSPQQASSAAKHRQIAYVSCADEISAPPSSPTPTSPSANSEHTRPCAASATPAGGLSSRRTNSSALHERRRRASGDFASSLGCAPSFPLLSYMIKHNARAISECSITEARRDASAASDAIPMPSPPSITASRASASSTS